MKNFKLFALACLLIMSLVFTACGDTEGDDTSVYGKSDKKISVKPGDVTKVEEGYKKNETAEYSFIHPTSWGKASTASTIVNFETGEALNVLSAPCEMGYTHKEVTAESFDTAVAPLKKAFYKFSNVKDLGSGYFLADVGDEKWTMRIEYNAENNTMYYLVSTATDAQVENTFFGSFEFAK